MSVKVRDIEVEQFFTPTSLATYLNLSPRTVRDMLKRRVIASYRVEGARRIAPDDVEQYLASRRDERRAA